MQPEFIVMLTYNDCTVENAREIFRQCADVPVTQWGFKDIGLPPREMQALVEEMKTAGKTTYLEVVSLSEAEGLRGASLAAEAGFDVLMGTTYFDSIAEYLRDRPLKYYPFPGHVYSHPSILDGTIAEIVSHVQYLERRGVEGMDLLTYRYTGDAPALLEAVVAVAGVPVVSAGSIDSYDRIGQVRKAGAWGFTIGSALFDGRFVPGGSFRDNARAVCDWLENGTDAAI